VHDGRGVHGHDAPAAPVRPDAQILVFAVQEDAGVETAGLPDEVPVHDHCRPAHPIDGMRRPGVPARPRPFQIERWAGVVQREVAAETTARKHRRQSGDAHGPRRQRSDSEQLQQPFLPRGEAIRVSLVRRETSGNPRPRRVEQQRLPEIGVAASGLHIICYVFGIVVAKPMLVG
jgi:hypothetical protein